MPYDVSENWHNFLIDAELSKNYLIVSTITGGDAVDNPVIERILPSLLHIKMTAILDETLIAYMSSNNITQPRNYRRDLNGRIEFFAYKGLILNDDDLHAIRSNRNDTAHKSQLYVSWDQLDKDITSVHSTLQHLGYVGNHSKLTVDAVQEKAEPSNEPNKTYSQNFSVRVLDDKNIISELKWQRSW